MRPNIHVELDRESAKRRCESYKAAGMGLSYTYHDNTQMRIAMFEDRRKLKSEWHLVILMEEDG